MAAASTGRQGYERCIEFGAGGLRALVEGFEGLEGFRDAIGEGK